jgi:hypothetical protein
LRITQQAREKVMLLFTLAPAPLLLYAFRYRDELTGQWTKARYRAEHMA